jgi:16S rRNA processing protein RimM
MVMVGRVVRPHGLRGQVVIAPETDFGAERFAPGAQVWRQAGEATGALTVVDSHPQSDRWVVAFEGVTSVEEAEALRGLELRIPEDARMPLGPDEYYLYDLLGCEVRTLAGEEIGRVQAVYTGAGGALLSVDREGAEVLVPLVKTMCPEIDVAARRIVVDPPEGLLDVNLAKVGKSGSREVGK